MEKLPIWGTVKQSFQFCFKNFGQLMKLSLIPIILYAALPVVLSYVVYAFYSTFYSGRLPSEWGILLWNVISIFCLFLVSLPVITAWYRKYLIHQVSDKKIGLRFGRSECRYLGYFFAVFFISVGAIVGCWAVVNVYIERIEEIIGISEEIYAFLAFFSGIVGTMLALYLYARLTMVFPAAAIGARAGIKESEWATDGFVLNIIGIKFLALLIIVITPHIFSFFAGIIDNMVEETIIYIDFIMGLVYAPIYFFTVAVAVTCVSIIYQFLSERDKSRSSPPDTESEETL